MDRLRVVTSRETGISTGAVFLAPRNRRELATGRIQETSADRRTTAAGRVRQASAYRPEIGEDAIPFTWPAAHSRITRVCSQGSEILERVAALPVTRWRYKKEPDAAHIGPVAEDFYSSFGVGADDAYIAALDGNGVALAAIQGLYELVKELQAENEQMRAAMERAGLE